MKKRNGLAVRGKLSNQGSKKFALSKTSDLLNVVLGNIAGVALAMAPIPSFAEDQESSTVDQSKINYSAKASETCPNGQTCLYTGLQFQGDSYPNLGNNTYILTGQQDVTFLNNTYSSYELTNAVLGYADYSSGVSDPVEKSPVPVLSIDNAGYNSYSYFNFTISDEVASLMEDGFTARIWLRGASVQFGANYGFGKAATGSQLVVASGNRLDFYEGADQNVLRSLAIGTQASQTGKTNFNYLYFHIDGNQSNVLADLNTFSSKIVTSDLLLSKRVTRIDIGLQFDGTADQIAEQFKAYSGKTALDSASTASRFLQLISVLPNYFEDNTGTFKDEGGVLSAWILDAGSNVIAPRVSISDGTNTYAATIQTNGVSVEKNGDVTLGALEVYSMLYTNGYSTIELMRATEDRSSLLISSALFANTDGNKTVSNLIEGVGGFNYDGSGLLNTDGKYAVTTLTNSANRIQGEVLVSKGALSIAANALGADSTNADGYSGYVSRLKIGNNGAVYTDIASSTSGVYQLVGGLIIDKSYLDDEEHFASHSDQSCQQGTGLHLAGNRIDITGYDYNNPTVSVASTISSRYEQEKVEHISSLVSLNGQGTFGIREADVTLTGDNAKLSANVIMEKGSVVTIDSMKSLGTGTLTFTSKKTDELFTDRSDFAVLNIDTSGRTEINNVFSGDFTLANVITFDSSELSATGYIGQINVLDIGGNEFFFQSGSTFNHEIYFGNATYTLGTVGTDNKVDTTLFKNSKVQLSSNAILNVNGTQEIRELIIGNKDKANESVVFDFGTVDVADSKSDQKTTSGKIIAENMTIYGNVTAKVTINKSYFEATQYETPDLLLLNESPYVLHSLIEAENLMIEGSDITSGGSVIVNQEGVGESSYVIQNVYQTVNENKTLKAVLAFEAGLKQDKHNDRDSIDLTMRLAEVDIQSGMTIDLGHNSTSGDTSSEFTAKITGDDSSILNVNLYSDLSLNNSESQFAGSINVINQSGNTNPVTFTLAKSTGAELSALNLDTNTNLKLSAGVQQSVAQLTYSDSSKITMGAGSKLLISQFGTKASSTDIDVQSSGSLEIQNLLTKVSANDSNADFTLSLKGHGKDYIYSLTTADLTGFDGHLALSNMTVELARQLESLTASVSNGQVAKGLTLGEGSVLKVFDSDLHVKNLVIDGGTILTNVETQFVGIDKQNVALTVEGDLTIKNATFQINLKDAALDSYKDIEEAGLSTLNLFKQSEGNHLVTLLALNNDSDFILDRSQIGITFTKENNGSSEDKSFDTFTTEDGKTYGLGVTDDQYGISLAFALLAVEVKSGKSLALELNETDEVTRSAAYEFNAKIIGEGGVTIGEKAGSIGVVLSNGQNSYKGDTVVEAGAKLIIGSSSALGNTSKLDMKKGTMVLAKNASQTIGALVMDESAVIDIDESSKLIVNGEAQLSGNNTIVVKDGSHFSTESKLTLAGTNAIEISGSNSEFAIKNDVQFTDGSSTKVIVSDGGTFNLHLANNQTVSQDDFITGDGTWQIRGYTTEKAVVEYEGETLTVDKAVYEGKTLTLSGSNTGFSGNTVINDNYTRTNGTATVEMQNPTALGSSVITITGDSSLKLAWTTEGQYTFNNVIQGGESHGGNLIIAAGHVALTNAADFNGSIAIEQDNILSVEADRYFSQAEIIGTGELRIEEGNWNTKETFYLNNINEFDGNVVIGGNLSVQVGMNSSANANERNTVTRSYEIGSNATLTLSGQASAIKNSGTLILKPVASISTVKENESQSGKRDSTETTVSSSTLTNQILTVGDYVGSEGSVIRISVYQEHGQKPVYDVLNITGQATGQSSVEYYVEAEDDVMDSIVLINYSNAVTDYLNGTFKLDASHTSLALGAEVYKLVPIQEDHEIAGFDYGEDVSGSGYLLMSLAKAEDLIERLDHPERFDAEGNRIATAEDESGTTQKPGQSGSSSYAGSIYRTEIGAYQATYMAAGAVQFNFADRETASYVDAVTGEKRNHNAWLRQLAQHRHFKSGHDQIKTHSTISATTLGVDLLGLELSDTAVLKSGVVGSSFFGKSNSSNILGYNLASAKSKTNGFAGGVYATVMSADQCGDSFGWYVDTWLQRVYSKNTITSDTVGKEKFHGNGWMASAETGVNLPLITSDMTDNVVNVSVQPKAQVVYEKIKYAEYREKTGTTVNALGNENVALKLGARLNSNWRLSGDQTKISAYADVYWNHQSKDRGVALNSTNMYVQSMRNTISVDVGTEVTVKKNFAGWIKMGTNRSGDNYHEEHIAIGAKYRF